MNILKWPLKNPVFINMVMILAIVAGLLSLRMLPTELNPEISLNWANVSVLYNGASPEEMEKLVTIKLEDAIADVDNIQSITSWSGEGFSRISIKFEDIPDDLFQSRYQEMVSEIGKLRLPEGAEDPFYFKWSSSTFLPVLNVAIFANIEEHELKKIARDIRDQISDLSSISKINSAGDRDREVWVELIPERLTALKLSFEEVQIALQEKNISISAGSIKSQENEVLFRLLGEFKSKKDLEESIIRMNKNSLTRLKDIAVVKESFKRAASISKFNGKPSITLSAYKKPGFGTQDVVADIRSIIEENRSKLPASIGIDYATDTSYMIDDGIGVLSSNALMGVILVLFILHLFLGSRNAIFAAIGIPTSFLITFIFLWLTDQSLNLNVMFGMVLVLGMIVDDAMVIIENVYRYIEKGLSPIAAVKKGVPEVALPVTSSIMTTMAAFLPLMLMPGIMGKFMRTIPFVVCLSLVASIVEAFFIMPIHIAQFGKANKKEAFGERYIAVIRNLYDKALKSSLTGKGYLLGAVLIVFFLGVGLLVAPEGKIAIIVLMLLICILTILFMFIKKNRQKRFIIPLLLLTIFASLLVMQKTIQVNMFAAEPFNMVFIRVKAPEGTSLEEMERILTRYENEVKKLPNYEYKSVITNVGVLNLDTEVLNGSNVGEIIFDVIPPKNRSVPDGKKNRSVVEIVADLKEKTKNITGVEWLAILYPEDGPPSGKAIEAKILGKDFAILKEISQRIQNFLSEQSAVKDIDSDFQEGKTEFRFYPNEFQVKSSGLNYSKIANAMQKVVSGQAIGIMRDKDEEMNIVLKYPEHYIQSQGDGKAIRISNSEGELVPLSNLGEFKQERVLSTIKRFKKNRSITVTADVEEGSSAVEVNQGIVSFFNDIKGEYPGYRLSFEGEFKEFESAFNSLLTLFMIGIGLMFVILGTQFKSWVRPFLIMLTIPLAFVGAMFGLVVSGNPFSIGSMYGMVALAGVVVNSAIVLVDFINKKRREGFAITDAILSAGHIRFRPIVLTTLTTVFGMLPLAIGIGGRNLNWQPLAIVIVAGLFISTILTLFLIPTFYVLIDDFMRFYKRSSWYKVAHRTIFSLLALLAFVGALISADISVALIALLTLLLAAFIFDMEVHDSKMEQQKESPELSEKTI